MDNGRLIASRFQIGELIGQGGMGDVYRGVDSHTFQPVAIKALKRDIVEEDPGLVERFMREGEALRQLNHPNIVKMLAAVEEDNRHYLVMEYVGGGSLSDLLRDHAGLPIERALHIGLDLADALTRAHRLNIIHRDIKPANILLAEDGTPRLTDFGVAHLGDSTRVTQTGAIIGTYAYLSPEAFNSEELDARTDLWAFGVVLYEMLAGRPPFDEPNAGALMMAIMTKPLPDLQAIRPDVPDALADLIYRMLEKDRERRIPSVRLVGAELDGLIRGVVIDTSTMPAVQSRESPFVTPTTESSLARHNLPAQTTPFVGREEELEELARLLADSGARLITLLGPGGMGKTRLSLEAAQRALNTVPDGVWFVALAPLPSPDFIVPTIAEAVRFSFYNADDPKTQLLDFLREKQMLLVMDNFEHLIEGARLVTDMLQAAPSLKVLATSRERLRLTGETVLEVQGMRFPEYVTPADVENYASVRLFVQSARRVQPAFAINEETAPVITRISRLVQGMPLGIELAAAWLEALTPQEILSEIERSFDFLETELRDVPERHRSVRAVFEYSWNLLNDDEREVFKRLSVFRGGFTREAAEAVAGASLRSLTALVNKSLLRRLPTGRYEIHELLRQYAERRLNEAAAGKDETHHRHSSYYADFLADKGAEINTRSQKKALNAIEAEIENIRAAWSWSVERGLLENIGRALDAMTSAYDSLSWFQEGAAIFQQAVETLSRRIPDQDDLLLWRVRLSYAWMIGRMGQYDANFQIARDALPIFRREKAHRDAVVALNHLAYVAMMQGRYDEARQYSLDAEAAAQQLGDRWLLFLSTGNTGYVEYLAGNYETARKIYEEGVRQADALGVPLGMGISRNNLGEILHAMSRERESKRLFEESAALFRETGSQRWLAVALNNLGNVAHAMGDMEEARRYNQQSYDLYHQVGDRRGMADALNRLGGVAYSVGDFRLAEKYHRQALDINHQIGDRRGEANALVQLADNVISDGDYDQAEALFKEAVAIRRELGNPSEIADALQFVGLIHTLRRNFAESVRWHDEAMAVMEQAGAFDPVIAGRDHTFRSVNHLMAEDWQAVKDAWERSLPEFETREIKWLQLQGHLGLAYAEWGLGNLAAAREHGRKGLQITLDIGAQDWVFFQMLPLGLVIASQGQPEHGVEILSFARYNPRAQHFMREFADDALDKIRPQLSPAAFAAAVERGKTLQWENVVAELLAE